MPKPFDTGRAADALEALDLNALNRELAQHWLSLWQDGVPPGRGAINPARLLKFLPGLAVMDIHSDDSIRFRIAGRAFRAAFGFDPSRHDMLALSLPEQRAAQIARCRQIADGAVATGIRFAHRSAVPEVLSQDVMLPLGGAAEDGTRSWLFHSTWRPGLTDWEHRLPARAVGMIDSYVARPLA